MANSLGFLFFDGCGILFLYALLGLTNLFKCVNSFSRAPVRTLRSNINVFAKL